MLWRRCYPRSWLRHRGIVPSSAPGRPKKIRLEAQKDNKASKTIRVLDILGQTTDSKTKETYVLVHWANATEEDDITWTSIHHLSPLLLHGGHLSPKGASRT